MKKSMFTALLLIMIPASLFSQDSFSRMSVDTPTAGLMQRGTYSFGVRLSPGGGVLGEFNLGIFDRFELGVSYGGMNVIGTGNVDWYPRVEFQAKYRLIDETVGFPAIAIGYDSQGYDAYDSGLERYEIKSRGFYGVLSKNYNFFGELGLHAGYGVSFEGKDDDEGEPDFFVGLTKSINPDLMIMLEYDLPISNDNIARSFDEGKGFLNAGVRMRLVENISIEVDWRNLNENARHNNRTIRIVYESPLF